MGGRGRRNGRALEMQNTGDPALRQEVVATVEHVLSDRAGDWRVSIIGSQANDRWEMKITGPNAEDAGRSGFLLKPERLEGKTLRQELVRCPTDTQSN